MSTSLVTVTVIVTDDGHLDVRESPTGPESVAVWLSDDDYRSLGTVYLSRAQALALRDGLDAIGVDEPVTR